MTTQVIRNQYNEIQIGNFCQFGVKNKTKIEVDEIPSNEIHFTTLAGTVDYVGNQGDQIFLSDGTTVTLDEEYLYDIAVPTGKHKVKLVDSINRSNYVSIGGEALVELHNFPTLSSVNAFDTNSSPNLVKVPTALPSNIVGLSGMFYGATSFNQDISSWDVSNVNYMGGMFEAAIAFDQDISMWDTSNVLDMSYMFSSATAFNQPLNNWDTSNVTNMQCVFNGASAFNQPLNNWDTSNVLDMSYMFDNARAFNQDIGSWNVSNVTDMTGMFSIASTFNQDLSQWCVSNITSKPYDFDQEATNWALPRPVWGTCPSGDGDSNLNLDLYLGDIQQVWEEPQDIILILYGDLPSGELQYTTPSGVKQTVTAYSGSEITIPFEDGIFKFSNLLVGQHSYFYYKCRHLELSGSYAPMIPIITSVYRDTKGILNILGVGQENTVVRFLEFFDGDYSELGTASFPLGVGQTNFHFKLNVPPNTEFSLKSQDGNRGSARTPSQIA